VKPLAVCIDGFNLSMSKGSGIATYGRNLSASIRGAGLQSHILYGPAQGFGKHNLENELALFDAPTTPSRLSRMVQFARAAVRLDRPGASTARLLRSTGAVITQQVEAMFPPCDAVWAGQDIFGNADRAFSARGRFTDLDFDIDAGLKPDVMHWTYTIPIRATRAANLYTIHDLIPLRLPFATLDNKRRFLDICREICASADRVVTVSEHTRRDIVQILGVPEEKISVTHQAVILPPAVTALSDDDVAAEISGVFGLDWRSYYIFFGAIEPKKNLARVIEAYLASGVKAPLIIIGGKTWLDDDETRLIYDDLVRRTLEEDKITRRADRIRRYDYLPQSLLMSLIRGARATFLPSLYEGFGLPVLESMALGTPVLTSTAGALPEVAGDAALLVDPYDTQAIRRAMVALDADAELRDSLSERGRKQAAKFSPDVYQTKLADLYRPFH
jgi:glycosyltransferase involved in cell wall biosynthesis